MQIRPLSFAAVRLLSFFSLCPSARTRLDREEGSVAITAAEIRATVSGQTIENRSKFTLEK